jgi:site-specific DNA recombinase
VRVAIYARVSTEEQVRGGTSLETQLERCRAHIESREGWELADEYVDAGVSGARANRPQLDLLMRACRAREVEAIVVTKLDRFGRSLAHLAPTLTELDRLGVAFVSLAEQIDSSTIAGRAMRGILGVFAEMEREVIVERTVSGIRAVAADGKWPGGPAPFGLRTVRRGSHSEVELDEEEAAVVRAAARLIAVDGCSLAETAARLNALGLGPRRAERWDRQNLRRALKQRYLMGEYIYAKQGEPGYRRYGKHGDPIALAVPPVLLPDEYGALQAALGETKRGPVRGRHFYLLSGRLFGLCGQPFAGVYRNDRGWRQYRCRGARHEQGMPRCDDRHRVYADAIEGAVWDEVAALLGTPERLLSMASDYLGLRTEQATTERDQIAVVDSKIAALERSLATAYASGLKAGLDDEALSLAVTQLNEELAALRRHRAQLEAWRADAEAVSVRMRRLWELAESAHRRLDTMEPQERRAVLALLDVRVRVTSYDPLTVRIEGCVHEGLSLEDPREPALVGPQGLEPCPPD